MGNLTSQCYTRERWGVGSKGGRFYVCLLLPPEIFTYGIYMNIEDHIEMAKYRCSYCQSDISGYRAQCAECFDIDLCLQVF